MGVGIGLGMISFGPLLLEILEIESGLGRKQTDGLLAGVMTTAPYLGMIIGPTAGGLLIDSVSAAGAALCAAAALTLSSLTLLAFIHSYCGVKLAPE